MKIYNAKTNIAGFIAAAGNLKNKISDYGFLYLKLLDDELTSDQIIKTLKQVTQETKKTEKTAILDIETAREMVILLPLQGELSLGGAKVLLRDQFTGEEILTKSQNLKLGGLNTLLDIITPYVNQEALPEKIALKKLGREENVILILDDDVMMTKMIERILENMGQVISIHDHNDLANHYIKYAPDVLILDIHLRGAKGNEILQTLKEKIDPHAHIIMISSDTKQDLILDIKEKGANGFIVKPFNREKVLAQIQNVPTIFTTSTSKLSA